MKSGPDSKGVTTTSGFPLFRVSRLSSRTRAMKGRPGPPHVRPASSTARPRAPRPAGARGPPAQRVSEVQPHAPPQHAPKTSGRGGPLLQHRQAPSSLRPPDALPVADEAAPEPAAFAIPPPTPRKFSPFSPGDAVSARLRGTRRTFPAPDDPTLSILVTALSLDDAPTAASILVDAFAGAMRTPGWARAGLGSHIESYVQDHVRMVPRALLLGARLVPSEALAAYGERDREEEAAAADPLAAALSPEEAAFPLIGVGELSFSETTRTKGLTLNPPPGGAYLCNMAVAPSVRGRGVGAALLAAAEGAAVEGGAREVYLHLRDRDGDGPGGRLYRRAGFVVEARDPVLLALVLAQDRRALLRKRLW